MSRGGVTVPAGWTLWQDPEAFRSGYSFKAADGRKAEVDRRKNPATGLIEWRSFRWRGADQSSGVERFHGIGGLRDALEEGSR